VERVLLLTALAQGAGLPARPVWGLVRLKGRWQLRTWAEVWTGTWLPLDPAAGPRGTDAGRIRLATGGVGRLLDLAIRAGRLRLEVLEEKR
jgi:transglutaminase-like putative cysteine protease